MHMHFVIRRDHYSLAKLTFSMDVSVCNDFILFVKLHMCMNVWQNITRISLFALTYWCAHQLVVLYVCEC